MKLKKFLKYVKPLQRIQIYESGKIDNPIFVKEDIPNEYKDRKIVSVTFDRETRCLDICLKDEEDTSWVNKMKNLPSFCEVKSRIGYDVTKIFINVDMNNKTSVSFNNVADIPSKYDNMGVLWINSGLDSGHLIFNLVDNPYALFHNGVRMHWDEDRRKGNE